MEEVLYETCTIRSHDGTFITYEARGHGPLLLLVHGALSDRLSARQLTKLLASQFTVITYDRRGRGTSEDARVYSVQKEIDDMRKVAQAVGHPRFVYGMSSGALLVLMATKYIPFEKIALYEPPAHMKKTQLRQMAESVRQYLVKHKKDEAVQTFLSEATGMTSDVIGRLKRHAIWPKFLSLADTLLYDIAIAEQFSLQLIRDVAVPSIVMGGTKSPRPVQQCVKCIAQALPEARFELLPDQGHNVDAAAIYPYLTSFFQQDKVQEV